MLNLQIDGEGVVRTSQELDYEIKDLYDLKIIATGAFPNQIRTQMIVEGEDFQQRTTKLVFYNHISNVFSTVYSGIMKNF